MDGSEEDCVEKEGRSVSIGKDRDGSANIKKTQKKAYKLILKIQKKQNEYLSQFVQLNSRYDNQVFDKAYLLIQVMTE